MINKATHTRIWVKTLRKLRFLHAETGKSMVLLMDELVTEALDKARRDNEKRHISD